MPVVGGQIAVTEIVSHTGLEQVAVAGSVVQIVVVEIAREDLAVELVGRFAVAEPEEYIADPIEIERLLVADTEG